MKQTVVIVGGGQAGHSTSAKLRSSGFDGRIILVCEEEEIPYQRPPLSKKYLLGTFERDRLPLRPRQFYDDNEIELLLGEFCTRISPAERLVETVSGKLAYDHLVLATGSFPKSLPEQIGGNLHGVHTVRTVRDIDRIRDDHQDGMRVLVVGGGYIGLETAASILRDGLRSDRRRNGQPDTATCCRSRDFGLRQKPPFGSWGSHSRIHGLGSS